jgi:hypothetical protein
MRIVSIDPGIRATGVGVFLDQQLVDSGYIRNPLEAGLGAVEAFYMAREIDKWLCMHGQPIIDVLVLEWPQVYQVSKGDPNDLLPLSGVDAALVTKLWHPSLVVRQYLPREWKGQAPKEVMCERIKSRLTPPELDRVFDAGALTHNVLDAIGLGLHYLGRLSPKKVFAR